ncbi:MAG: NAD(P)-dependent oxidoreductase [Pseudonocardiaceae bacterium]
MKITVFGATGQTGQQVVQQALDKDYEVTAVVRDPSRLGLSHERLRVVRADLFDPESIAPAVNGSDAVISALGATSRKPTSVCEAGVRSIIRAMRATGVRRLVVVSNSAHTPADGDSAARRLFVFVLGRILKNPFADLRLMEQEIQGSGLDWTIVRPARMTNGTQAGRYRTALGGHVPAGWSVARADVADSVLRLLGDDTTVRNVVGVAY